MLVCPPVRHTARLPQRLLPRPAAATFALALLMLPVAALPLAAQDAYRLGAGDVLKVTVIGEEAYSGDYRIGAAGTVAVADLEPLPVAGLTVTEARQAIVTALKRYLKHPLVNVTLDEAQSQRHVSVLGAVKKPVSAELPFGATVAVAIAAAEGFADGAVTDSVVLQRTVGPALTLDLSPVDEQPPADASTLVRSGDVIWVPLSKARLTVLGPVQRPGRYPLPADEEVTVLDAVGVYAQGPGLGVNLGDATVLREGQEPRRVRLRKLLIEGDLTEDVALQPGDVVVVSEAAQITVVGAVARPVSFAPTDRTTVVDALAEAGGLTATSDLHRAAVIREGQRIPVDLAGLWLRGSTENNIPLEPGDVVLVPEANNQVVVVGEVEKPGIYDIGPDTRVLGALSLAAGATADADLAHVTIMREDENIVANLDAVLRQGQAELNFPVVPGDVVLVPPANKAYVLGGVNEPGAYSVTARMTLVDLLAQAGGVHTQGDPRRITLARRTATGEQALARLTMERTVALSGVDPSLNIQPGDVVYVPAKRQARDVRALRDIFIGAAGIAIGLLRN
jgi:protein involved in polysaccharide export with SLBB domain